MRRLPAALALSTTHMALHEVSWRPEFDPALTHALLPWVEEPERYEWAYAVYVNPDRRALIGAAGSFGPVAGTPFQEHLRRHPFDGLWDAAFAADAFATSDPPFSPALNWTSPSHPAR